MTSSGIQELCARSPQVDNALEETQACVLPHAERVNADMFRELSDLVENRRQLLPRLRNLISTLAMLPSDTQKFHSGRQAIRP